MRRLFFTLFLGAFLLVAGGWLFLFRVQSSSTTTEAFSQRANRYLKDEGQELKLLLQTDPRWAARAYGSGSTTNDLATNGCGIASLAMILSYYQQRDVLPTEILAWAGDRYYEPSAGTTWSIFPAFAEQYQLPYQNLEKNAEKIQQLLNQQQPILLSMNPGEFTKTGHLMVIIKDRTSDKILAYDPNDAPEKQHYRQKYTLDQLLKQSANAWAFAR